LPINSLTAVIILSILVEFVTNVIKSILPIIKKNGKSHMIAAVLGIVLCISTGVGILQSLDISINIAYIDYAVTGLVVSRGSNAVHDMRDLFKKNLS